MGAPPGVSGAGCAALLGAVRAVTGREPPELVPGREMEPCWEDWLRFQRMCHLKLRLLEGILPAD